MLQRREILHQAFGLFWAATVAILAPINVHGQSPISVRVVVSTQDRSKLLAPQEDMKFHAKSPVKGEDVLRIDPTKTYQTILGLGTSLEPTTCFNLSRLSIPDREEALQKLFDREKGIGVNLTRICIGTPDFTGDPWYTYDDVDAGKTDPDLKAFSIEKDKKYILPVLRDALAVNKDLLFIASPWSPPAWMKSTQSLIGGRLLPEHYGAYAKYFVKFLEAYAREGIPVYAVTVQNEPGVDRSKEPKKWHYPSCKFTGEEEAAFIRDHLGPAIQKSGLKTQIWCYDHNFNLKPTPSDPGIGYPQTILSDLKAANFVAGVAFHGYAGEPAGMSTFHERFPAKPIYFTEGSVFGLGGGLRLCQLMRNWASGYCAWVTMIDETGKPNNGPFRASRTCIMLDPKTLKVDYRFDYYLFGHFMKYIRRGAVRIDSGEPVRGVGQLAFRNPDGEIVLILVNAGLEARKLRIEFAAQALSVPLASGSIATLRWPSP
jgi:glucosylceramidase